VGRKKNDASWFQFYELLGAYYQEHGDIKVPAKYITPSGIKLGSWFKKQKELYAKGLLIDERIELLEKYPITWNIFEDEWNKHYAYLKKYYEIFGNSNVPQNYITSDGFKLGDWLSTQRVAYKNGVVSKRRKKLLKEVDFKLYPAIDRWDDFYYLLEDYLNCHGDTNVPFNYIVDQYKLGRWVATQRQSYTGTTSNVITKDRIMLLNDLGFDWSRKDTQVLKSEFTSENFDEYRKIMLKRMRHILEDLSYEADEKIDDISKQKSLEKDIVKRMWK